MKLKKFYIMKTKTIFTLAFLFAILLAVASCTKPVNPPTPIPSAPIIHLSGVTTHTLNYGDSTSFSWEVAGDNVIVVLNGKAVKSSETFSTGRLLADKTYKLTASNAGGTVDSSFSIKVGDWTTSDYGIISHDHWIFGSISQKSDQTNNQWVVFSKEETGPLFYTFAYYFLPDGVWQIKDRPTGKLITSGHWDIKGDSLIYKEGYHALILQATKDTFATETSNYATGFDGKEHLIYGRLLYIRDTTK